MGFSVVVSNTNFTKERTYHSTLHFFKVFNYLFITLEFQSFHIIHYMTQECDLSCYNRSTKKLAIREFSNSGRWTLNNAGWMLLDSGILKVSTRLWTLDTGYYMTFSQCTFLGLPITLKTTETWKRSKECSK